MNKNTHCIFLLPLLILIFFCDILFFGKTLSTASLLPGATPSGPYGFSGQRPEMPFSFDVGGNAWVNEPNPYIIRRLLNEGGELPFWNPHEGLGMPLIANMNNEVLNPLKLALNLSPGPFSQDIFFLLRLLVMGIFTYLFLRELKLSPASCLLGSSSFMLSGYSVWWINLHPLSTVMYLPAVFYFYERWGNRKDLKSPFLMSLFLCFAFVAGKIPDVIMGLSLLFSYALWKGIMEPSRKRFYREGGKVLFVALSGALMAAVALIPFIELHSHASPLAKAIRTGAAGHTIPFITSVSLFQPLFLGWKNYFYGSWLRWTPDVILPYATTVILLLTFYAVLNRTILTRTFPYFVFSIFLFSIVYGLLPSHIMVRLPVFRSIEFLKYNGMLYFSLSVMSAHSFDNLLSAEGNKKRFLISIAVVSLLILAYFSFLYRLSPSHMSSYMITILLFSLAGLFIIGLVFHFFESKQIFGIAIFLFLMGELFLYMPKEHPDRTDPYRKPPYLDLIKGREPYRITGDGSSLPPLVSGAFGLYDARGISVLMQGDYYYFFENLLGFSLPGTNNPDPLFTATSPFIDLAGVKYIMSREPLERSKIEEKVRSHIGSLRLVRLFEAMMNHAIKGEATYGSFDPGGDMRFSIFFPMTFAFETKLRISEPFIVAGFTLTDVPKGATARVRITMKNRVEELIVREGDWKDQWLDVSNYSGKVITIRIEGTSFGNGRIVLGNFGLSPGYERERILYNNLLTLHKKELDFLKYKGAYEGIHIYENTNVMDRAFVLHRARLVRNLDEAIKELQEGADFREMGLVSDIAPEISRMAPDLFTEEKSNGGAPVADDKIIMKKYTADEVAMEVESRGGLLVLSDLYYPGWKVKVNGQQETIVSAFGLFKGVFIKGGRSEVLFYYRPISIYVGSIISAATFIAWFGFFMISRRKAKLR